MEFPAGIAQQVRQVVQALDVFEPERLPGEGDRPVLALPPEHRPWSSAFCGLGYGQPRVSGLAVPAGVGEVFFGPLGEHRHAQPPGRAERGRQQFEGPLPITWPVAGH